MHEAVILTKAVGESVRFSDAEKSQDELGMVPHFFQKLPCDKGLHSTIPGSCGDMTVQGQELRSATRQNIWTRHLWLTWALRG